MKILCYGDSNTYGYDPRSFLSDRYPDEDCWTTHLEKAGHHVLNYGMNGREIPYRPMAIESAITAFSAEQADLLLIMLGRRSACSALKAVMADSIAIGRYGISRPFMP